MVARGDLGIEVPYEELPIIQRRIVKTCLRIGRPVIVATHMLESMINSPMLRGRKLPTWPTPSSNRRRHHVERRNDGWQYPIKCVEVFHRIAERIERSGGANFAQHAELSDPREKIAKSAVVMADEVRATAIVTLIRSGSMTRYISWLRPRHSTIYAFARAAMWPRN